MRRAQITMFIMIGMILLVFAAIFFYAAEIVQKRVEVRVVEVSSAKELAEHCLGAVAEDALIVIARQAGSSVLQPDHPTRLQSNYGFDKGENLIPDVAAVEQELADYAGQHLASCTDNFASLESKGITVAEQGPPTVTVIIAERDVRFNIDWQIEEHKADLITRPEFIPVVKTARLKEMLELAHDIVESGRVNDGLFDLDVQCSLDVVHFPVDKELVTVITDNDFLIQDKPFRFVFAHRR